MPQDSLTTVIDISGIYYRIPIACINDPQAYPVNVLLERMQAEKVPEERKLQVSGWLHTFDAFRSKSGLQRATRSFPPRTWRPCPS